MDDIELERDVLDELLWDEASTCRVSGSQSTTARSISRDM
jgi:hypothetical protein